MTTHQPLVTVGVGASAGGLEALLSMFASVEPTGRMLLSNPKVGAVFGYGQGELIGSQVQDLVRASPSQKDPSSATVAGLFNPDTHQVGGPTLFKALRKDGSEVDVLISITPLPAQGSRRQSTHLSVRCLSPSTGAQDLDCAVQ